MKLCLKVKELFANETVFEGKSTNSKQLKRKPKQKPKQKKAAKNVQKNVNQLETATPGDQPSTSTGRTHQHHQTLQVANCKCILTMAE